MQIDLQAAIDAVADAIVGLSADDVVLLWSRGAERLFGYTADEMVGKKIHAIVPDENLARGEMEKVSEIVRREGRAADIETERVAKSGKHVPVALTRVALGGDHKIDAGSIEILRDITEKRKLEQALAQAESLAGMGEMAANLAHEIRNPLAGIRGAFQVIEDGLPADDPRRAVMAEIKRQIARMDRTLTDLLSFARPRPPERRPFQVNLLLVETVLLMRGDASMRSVKIVESLDPDLPDVHVDPQQMQKVFLDIILNAGQAMPDGGVLAISSFRDDDAVELRFEDTGVGMSAEVLAQAFRPFFTTKTRGTGVGLSISQKIVEAHGGRLTARSRAGEGSTFMISLPVDGDAA